MVWFCDLYKKGMIILDSYFLLFKLRIVWIYYCGRLSKMDIWIVWVFLWIYLSCNIVVLLLKIVCCDGVDGSFICFVYVWLKMGMN